MAAATSDVRSLSWLWLLLDMRPGEGARVAVMLLYSAAAMGGVLTIGLRFSGLDNSRDAVYT